MALSRQSLGSGAVTCLFEHEQEQDQERGEPISQQPLARSDQQSGQNLAQCVPDPRIKLNVKRGADQEHQTTCFNLSHWNRLMKSIFNATTDSSRSKLLVLRKLH
jgi:hypothetical protein